MRIDSAGNVGIGMTDPAQRLQVAGNIRVTGTGNGVIFPDGSVQTTACGILFRAPDRVSASGRLGEVGGVVSRTDARASGNPDDCTVAASLAQVVQEQQLQIQVLRSELLALREKLEALAAAR